MATTLTKTQIPSAVGASAGTVVTLTAADTGAGNSFPLTGDDIVIVQNTDTSSHTYSVTSVADGIYGRTKDLTNVTIAAGAVHVLPRFPRDGWMQTDGTLLLSANHATVKFAVLKL